MPRARNPNRDKAKQIWLEHNGEIANRQIAEMIGENEKVVAVWKQRDKWNVVQQSDESCTTNENGGLSPPTKRTDNTVNESVNTDLTVKQKAFVQEYLVDLNATQAAIRAGYSPKTANEQGPRLLVNVSVQQAIAKAMDERSKRTQVNADWVLSRLVRLADYNLRDFANLATVKRVFETKSGDVLEDEIQTVVLNPNFDGSIAKALNQDKDGIKLEMPDRLKALELIGKHIGMFTDPHRVQMDKERLLLERDRLEIEKTKANKDQIDDMVIEVDLPDGEEMNEDADD